MTFLFLRTLFRSTASRYIAIAVGSMLVAGASVLYFHTPDPIITQIDPITTTIEVPVDRIVTKTVTKYVRVEDRAAIDALIKENEALRVRVTQLTVSLASSTSSGGGPVIPPVIVPMTDPIAPAGPLPIHFKDWRLDFTSDGSTVSYTLTQQFAIINTVGRNDRNVPVNLVRLFEIGPTGERVSIPVTESTTIAAADNQSRWYVEPTLQAGVGLLVSNLRTTPQVRPTVTIAIPWWKRGTARAVEATRYALLTPAVIIDGTQTSVGLLPVSFNLGTIHGLPLTDVWVSPYVGITKTQTRRLGIAFTATF